MKCLTASVETEFEREVLTHLGMEYKFKDK